MPGASGARFDCNALITLNFYDLPKNLKKSLNRVNLLPVPPD